MRKFILLAMVAGMSLTTLARPAMAATKTPFSSLLTFVSIIDPGTSWESGQTFHLRGQVSYNLLTGDLEGTAIVVLNQDLGPRGGSAWGTFEFTLADVIYEGSFTGVFPGNPCNCGSFEGQGSDGTQITQATFSEVDEGTLLEGIILDPNG